MNCSGCARKITRIPILFSGFAGTQSAAPRIVISLGQPSLGPPNGGCDLESLTGHLTQTAGFLAAHMVAGLALSQESTTTKGHVDQSTRDRPQSNNDAITILRERISTWVVVDILELF